ncbi:MAG: asparaginase domain-containing protein [Pseudomonadota bacterium]
MKHDPAAIDPLPLLLVDTGGTFNKRYDPVGGTLRVADESGAAGTILASAAGNLAVRAIRPVSKDSLDMTSEDRETVVAAIRSAVAPWDRAPVVVIHGTDTMALTAKAVAENLPGRRVVMTGAMRPFEIDAVEPAFNLGLALGYAQADDAAGVFVAMSGLVRPWERLLKDRSAGVFRPR